MCERAIQLRAYIDTWLAQEIALKEPTSNYSNYSHNNINNTPNSSNLNNAEVNYRDLKTLQLSAIE
jgi:hypothetical protein